MPIFVSISQCMQSAIKLPPVASRLLTDDIRVSSESDEPFEGVIFAMTSSKLKVAAVSLPNDAKRDS